MSRIDDIFSTLRPVGIKALMPFICGGYPRPGMLGSLLAAAESGGASIVEVGIPFSDPIADGPVIASAMHEALGAGATPASVMEEVRAVRANLGLGLVAMVSMSIVHRMSAGGANASGATGVGSFVAKAKECGFDGLIVPDAPLEESAQLREACKLQDVSFSMLISPTTPPERAAAIARACTGFVYVLARAGITGEQSGAPDVSQRIAQLRGVTDLPLVVGFGISTAEHVAAAVKHADAAIVGSALVRRIADAVKAKRDPVFECKQFVQSLSLGLLGDDRKNDPTRRLA